MLTYSGATCRFVVGKTFPEAPDFSQGAARNSFRLERTREPNRPCGSFGGRNGFDGRGSGCGFRKIKERKASFMKNKLAVIVLADGFEEAEAIASADVLTRSGIAVYFAGLKPGPAVGSHGFRIETQGSLDEAPWDSAGAIVLPGGLPGATNLMACARLREEIQKADAAGKILAAICAAPIVLHAAGATRGRRVAGYPGCESLCEKPGLRFSGNMTERDGNLVTGKGPGAAFLFGFEIARAVGVDESALQAVQNAMFVKPAAE